MKQECAERNFRKFGDNTRDCPLFQKFRKCSSIRYWKFSEMQTEISGQQILASKFFRAKFRRTFTTISNDILSGII